MNDRYPNAGPDTAPNLHAADTYEGRESIPNLVRGLAGDLTTLFSKEIALAKAEMREAAGHVKAAVASMAAGAVLAMAGVVILLMSAVYGLDNVVDLWLAALIVGLVAVIIGFVMIKGAASKVEPSAFTPERTIESLHKDKDTAERAIR
jgi:hypothetical protein